jgi:hypothetical protein
MARVEVGPVRVDRHSWLRNIARRAGPDTPAGSGLCRERSRDRTRSRRLRATLGLLVLSAGCAPPDRPAALDLPMPTDAIVFLRPDTVRMRSVQPGVVYRYLWSPEGPWAVHLVQAKVPDRCDLGLAVLRAEAREEESGRQAGRERVSRMVQRSGRRVLAAVNADFFTPQGAPVGPEIVGGTVWSASDRPAVAWRPGSAPWMGMARSGEGTLELGWLVTLPEGDGQTEAVGGFPDLIDAGRRVGDLEVEARPTFAAARHPRSGIAYDSRTGVLWVAVVDGRQLPHSAGMTLPEFAALFEALGADEALNLDGGGSTVLVVRGAVRNRPSDAEGERAVVNALALVQDPSGCRTAMTRAR